MSNNSAIDEIHPELFHYTTWDALVGILQNNTIWATNVRYLNDTSEYHLAEEYLSQNIVISVREKLNSLAIINLKAAKFIEENGGVEIQTQTLAKDIIHAFYQINGSDFYVSSFCGFDKESYEASHGLLSQWRGYGGELGFCLVFNTKKLLDLLRLENEKYFYLPSHLSDVVYSHETSKLQQEFGAGLEIINQYVRDFLSSQILGIPQGSGTNAQVAFMQTATRYKHQGFQQEREVRIVLAPVLVEAELTRWRDSQEGKLKIAKEIKYRRWKNLSAPYIELLGTNFGILPIERIIVGPGQNNQEAIKLIRRMIRDRNIEVTASGIPYV